MKVLVVGGTGTVGSQVVTTLLNRKADVRVMTSSQEKLNKLPRGVDGVVGNLKDGSSLQNAFRGVERVFLLTPLSETETQEGLNAVEAARSAGVKRIVYMSIHRLEDIPGAPHFSGKIPIEGSIKASGIPYTILRPNNFYQNDYWFKQPLLEFGIYGQPLGNTGAHRVDVRDIAEAACNALLNDGYTGKTFALVGPEKLTGTSTAKTYGKYLGKEVIYAGDDLKKWAEQAGKMMPRWLVDDFRIMYDHFQKKGLLATPEHISETERILGKKPRTFDAFAAETIRTWKTEATVGATQRVSL